MVPAHKKGNSMKPQMQYFWESHKRLADADKAFLELVNDPKNPMTNDDLSRLIARYPERYGRFAGFVGKLKDAPTDLQRA